MRSSNVNSPVYEMGMFEHARPSTKKYSIRDGVELSEAKKNKYHRALINMPVGAVGIVRDENYFNIYRQACFELNGKMMIYYITKHYENDKRVMKITKLGITQMQSLESLKNHFNA